MSLTHEEFFALAIDPDDVPDPALVPAIEEHRAGCAECRELERDYPHLLELAKSTPSSLPPEPPGMEERVMAAVREVIRNHGKGPSVAT